MQISLNPLIALPIAAIALGASVGIWYYLLRPAPEQQQTGIIEHIEFADKETVEKTEIRSIRNPDQLLRSKSYTLPDRFIYTIKLADGRTTRYQENAPNPKAEPEYSIGQQVGVTYQIRLIPFLFEKIIATHIDLDP